MATEQEINEAKILGWRPKEEWSGPAEQWADADVFLEKGRHVLPIMKQNNDRLMSTVQKQTEEIDTLRADLAENKEAMEWKR